MPESYGSPGRRKEAPDLLRMRIESGDEGVVAAHWGSALLIAAGWDPFALVDAAVAEAAHLSGDHRATVHALQRHACTSRSPGKPNPPRLMPAAVHTEAVIVHFRLGAGGAKPRAAKTLPEFVDMFGWCTWDAFYSRVSAEGSSHPANISACMCPAPLHGGTVCVGRGAALPATQPQTNFREA